ncbi:MAG: hypothetical protein ACE5J2_03800 [Nitrososphaerales archaeon]
MNSKHLLAILSALSLMMPMSFQAFGAFEDRRASTSIELDQIEECINTMQCNAQVFTGTTVKFTGILTDSEGTPLPDMQVNMVALIPTPELVVLTTTTTDTDGMFEADWVVKLSVQKTAFQDVLSQIRSESLTIFAEFPGSENMAPSKSNKLVMSVTVNTINALANSDKTLYDEGDTVTIFIAFIDSADNFVDPDSVIASLNTQRVELEKKKEGSYTFTITEVERKHQQLIVVPEKAGWNLSVSYLTIIVGGLR